MFTMLLKHLSSLTTHLRYLYDILSGLGADKLLYLLIVILNSSLEKKFYSKYCFDRSFPNRELLICWFWAELNVRWRAFQRTLILIHRHLLNWIISMASKLCPLTVRRSSHQGGSLQNGLGIEQTCGMTLASAYVLHCLSTVWLQLQMMGRSPRWKWVLIGVSPLNTRGWVQ